MKIINVYDCVIKNDKGEAILNINNLTNTNKYGLITASKSKEYSEVIAKDKLDSFIDDNMCNITKRIRKSISRGLCMAEYKTTYIPTLDEDIISEKSKDLTNILLSQGYSVEMHRECNNYKYDRFELIITW